MRAVRRIFYVLPLLVAAVVLLVLLALWALGADCNVMDADQGCSGVGEIAVVVWAVGRWLTVVSVLIGQQRC
jgi:hypothetical protein